MNITEVNIPKEDVEKYGLEAIKMEKLGSVVILAGKNGSGKTRILNSVDDSIRAKPISVIVENSIGMIPKLEEERLRLLPNQASALPFLQVQLENCEAQLKNHRNMVQWNKITTSEASNQYGVIRFIPKTLALGGVAELSRVSIEQSTQKTKRPGIENLSKFTLPAIQRIQDLHFNATHQANISLHIERLDAVDSYERLQSLILRFFGRKLERTVEGDATLAGFRLDELPFSDGQKILLQFCIALQQQETYLENEILILDEPENHLHPSVIIEMIDKIREAAPKAQIWIATHSIPIIAHFDPNSIWYVENGKVSHAGKIPERVLEGLLGGEEEIGRLRDFLDLPAQLATSRFAFECLLPPAVVETKATDPQSGQISKVLQSLSSNRPLKVLDYGAGKGRIISNIADLDTVKQTNLTSELDYVAFDEWPNDREKCEIAIAKAMGDATARYFNKHSELLTHHDAGSFDVVILCNVLHEIPHSKWLDLFKAGGQISGLLRETGYLLLVEDQNIPTGEKAYQNGFLILDTPQIKTLFDISATDTDFKFDTARSGRLKAHLIPRKCLERISATSRQNAIRSLSEQAKQEIKSIRDAKCDYANGKLHGFWTQQFANAQLCLAEMTPT